MCRTLFEIASDPEGNGRFSLLVTTTSYYQTLSTLRAMCVRLNEACININIYSRRNAGDL